MRTLVLGIITLAYPVLIYLGLGHFEPKWLALLLVAMALTRALLTKEKIWLIAAAGAALLAMVSFTSNQLLPLKLYPVLVNGVLCAAFALSLAYPPSAIERLARLSEPDLPESGVRYTRRVTQVWCGFFIFNGCAALITAFWSDAAWALYNGLIAYILMGALFLGNGSSGGESGLLMANFISLDRLLFTGRESTFRVAKNAGQSMDYDNFIKEVARWHHAFSLHSGHRFALYFNDSATFAAALLGAWHAGKCVYLPSDTLPATLQKLQESTDGFAGDVPAALSPIAAANESVSNWQVLDLNAVMLVVFTSGSSGEPCAIPKKLSQLVSEVAALEACFGKQSAGASVLATVSHQHIYGLLFRILWPLSAGRIFDTERLVYPEDIAAAISNASPEATILVASPAHLKRLPEQLDWQAQSLRAIFSSGGPLPAEALPACRNLLGSAPFEIYGSSETGGIAWRQRQQDHQTVWRTLPGIAIRVENETLFLRSPHLSNNDWQASNDRVTLTPNGFELLGRSDRIIKIEEKRISLSAMEQALLATELLDDVRLITLPGPRLSLGLIACPNEAGWCLIDKQGKKALNQALRLALADSSEASALPRRFRYTWALPSNTQSKTTHAALLALFDPRRPEARLIERSKDAALLEIDVNAGSPFFDGHFTTAPILPGVAQVEWALCLARELFELPAAFLRMEVLKFQQVILPGSQIQLELKTLSKDSETMLTFKFVSAAGTHASGRIVLGNPA